MVILWKNGRTKYQFDMIGWGYNEKDKNTNNADVSVYSHHNTFLVTCYYKSGAKLYCISVIHSVYEKEYLQNNTLLINVLKLLEYIFVAILLLIRLLYVFIVKIISELKETRVRMKKLKYLGMKEKLYRKILGFENNIIKIIPLVFGILGGIIYIFITFKIRYFTKIEQQQFWEYEMCIISIYIIIYLIVSFIISRINMWLVDKGE